MLLNKYGVSIIALVLLPVVAHAVPKPEVYYSFDNYTNGSDTVFADIGDTDATVRGGPTELSDTSSTPFNSGKGISFSDANQYLDLNYQYPGDQTWTVSYWIDTTEPGGQQDPWGASAGDENIHNFVNGGTGDFGYFFGPYDLREASTSDTWTHVSVVINEDTATFYVNGSVSDQETGGSVGADNLNFFLGAKNDGGGPKNRWGSAIDDYAVFDEALTQSEIQELSSGPISQSQERSMTIKSINSPDSECYAPGDSITWDFRVESNPADTFLIDVSLRDEYDDCCENFNSRGIKALFDNDAYPASNMSDFTVGQTDSIPDVKSNNARIQIRAFRNGFGEPDGGFGVDHYLEVTKSFQIDNEKTFCSRAGPTAGRPEIDDEVGQKFGEDDTSPSGIRFEIENQSRQSDGFRNEIN